MLRPRQINRFVRRYRRTVAVVGTLIVLGVAALDAHAALPEHHDHRGAATVCIAALAIATLVVFGFGVKRAARLLLPPPGRWLARPTLMLAADAPCPMARAGPPGTLLLPLRR